MQYRACQAPAKKNGRDRRGNQRYRCLKCSKRFAERPERPLGEMRLPVDRALLVLHLLTEGCSVQDDAHHGGRDHPPAVDPGGPPQGGPGDGGRPRTTLMPHYRSLGLPPGSGHR